MTWQLTFLVAFAGATACCAPVPIVFDTDIGSDCDDAGAVAVLHALADRGEAKILGMASCSLNPFSAAALDAINTYYGQSGIPIGTIKGELIGPPVHSSYVEYLAKNFPNKLRSAENAPDAVALYRRILAKQPDGSVVFVAVGWLTNLRNLLRSGPDEHSRLSGRELVKRKVKMLVDMGPRIQPPGKGWNFEQEPASAREVVNDWPTPIVFSPKEICWAMTGGRLNETPSTNPVRKAYELWFAKHGKGETTRHSADLTAVLYAVRGLGSYWTLAGEGRLEVREDGYSEWRSGPVSNHSYLVKKMPFEELAGVLDALMIQSPAKERR